MMATLVSEYQPQKTCSYNVARYQRLSHNLFFLRNESGSFTSRTARTAAGHDCQTSRFVSEIA